MIVDTDVLIWYLRGHMGAAQFLRRLSELALSAVNYMELVQGCNDKAELARLKKDLAARKATILPITEAISSRATTLLESHVLSHGLRMADALIAATAIEHNIAIATANAKHFQAIEGLRITKFQA